MLSVAPRLSHRQNAVLGESAGPVVEFVVRGQDMCGRALEHAALPEKTPRSATARTSEREGTTRVSALDGKWHGSPSRVATSLRASGVVEIATGTPRGHPHLEVGRVIGLVESLPHLSSTSGARFVPGAPVLLDPQCMHSLSEIDTEARTAVCSSCGPVRIDNRSPGWRCSAAKRPLHQRAMRRKRLRRRVAIALYKTLVGCERCGFNNHNPALLHIHHPENDGKEYGQRAHKSHKRGHPGAQHALANDSRVGFIAELLRCEVLCANCHRAEHHA